ncbi:hypothetical protein H5410_040898 [Solanum commersonii]|uniref:Uncharacterized protein n=1 Tax=Solanum commersonii TaxID=4109 RepID=A0A9J5XT98_SOLCO|nr:hypothetical protein H5410_040898 [Solanum commersonii]
MLKKVHHLSIIVILEPFSNIIHVQSFQNQLAMDHAMITCDITHNELHTQFTSTFVDDKCKDHLRRPCGIDFYTLLLKKQIPHKNLGGIPYNMRKSLEFIDVIEACGLLDLGFSKQKFIWSNKGVLTTESGRG